MRDELRILVRTIDGQRQIAVLKGHRLAEYYQAEARGQSLAGAVLLGRVERVLPQVGAAFVDIGEKLNGFLPLEEMESFEKSGRAEPLVTGRDVIVQVKKDARDEKGAFLTRDVGLPGQFCLFMPRNRHVGVSGRITEEGERARALALGQDICGGEAGIIVRHAAMTARAEDVRAEYAELRDAWQSMAEKARYGKAPAMLWREADPVDMLRRDYSARFTLSIADQGMDIERDALWQGAGVPRQLREALDARVDLPGGGTLVIDEREALTTIDVNTARFIGGGEADIRLTQNLAACPEIARQLRLRNISGMVLVDFIDMETDEQRQRVAERLEAELAEDRVKAVIHGFTKLGLLEMTRRRTRESLRNVLTEPCRSCGGSGRGKKEVCEKNRPTSLRRK